VGSCKLATAYKGPNSRTRARKTRKCGCNGHLRRGVLYVYFFFKFRWYFRTN